MLTIAEIQRHVAARYGLRFADMSSQDRCRVVARPRQVAMVLARQITARSRERIGRQFGGRDNTTVLYAEHVVKERRQQDQGLDRTIRELILDLLAPHAELPDESDDFVLLAGQTIRRDAMPSFPQTGAV